MAPPQRPASVLAAAILIAAALPLAAQGDAPGDTVVHLHGTVTDALTGQPLARALVSSGDHRLATMTDSNGRFSIDVHLPAPEPPAPAAAADTPARDLGNGGGPSSLFGNIPSVQLTARKPGYLPQEQPGQWVTLSPALDATELHLQLTPAGTLSGSVSAAGTDVARNVRLTLMRRIVSEGRFLWSHAGSQNTDAEGNFRFTDLPPGRYTVATAEWRGDAPRPTPGQPTEEYPPLFNGDTPTLTPAGIVLLRAGQTAEVELHLTRQTFYPVTIPLAPTSDAGNIAVRIDSDAGFNALRLSTNSQHHDVECWLPDGDYTVQLNAFPMPSGPPPPGAPPPRLNFGFASVHVAGAPAKTATVSLGPLPDVEVEIHKRDPNATLLFANLVLHSQAFLGGTYGGNLRIGQGDTFAISNVPPGRYMVDGHSNGYIASLTCDGVDLLTHPLVIGTDGLQRPIEMTVANDSGSISGQVISPPGAAAAPPTLNVLLLLPTDAGLDLQQFGVTAPGGLFSFSDVPPGTYRLFALGSLPRDIPFRDPDAMRAFATLGTAVTIGANQKVEANAPLLDAADLPASVDLDSGLGTSP